MKNFLKKTIKKINKKVNGPNDWEEIQKEVSKTFEKAKFESAKKEIEKLKKRVAALEYLVEYWMSKHENFRAALNEELDRATAVCEISDHPEDQLYLCGWSDQAWSIKDYLNCLFPEED